jgi:hypothetical protein
MVGCVQQFLGFDDGLLLTYIIANILLFRNMRYFH